MPDPSGGAAMTTDARYAGDPWRKALTRAIHVLRPSEGEGAATDARRLLAHVLKASWLELVKDQTRLISEIEAAEFEVCLVRRQRGEPVARIIGLRGFYGRDFVVSPATLDPRPETETLIDAALERMKPKWRDGAGLTILDIGAGTGCLLLTLLAEFPEARGVGVDPSNAALVVAQRNADRLGLAPRVRWVEGRFETAAPALQQRFPLIVSNPPYIPTSDIAGLERDVRDFDPHLALDGGADGLVIYREIVADLPQVTAGGWVFFEIGQSQSIEIKNIITTSRLGRRVEAVQVIPDMANLPRCVAFELRD